jgi:Ras-related protein Rab-23
MALVQNKVDLIDQAVVSPQEVEGLARSLKLKLYRTCVKDNLNVTDVFVYLSELHQRKEEARHEEQLEAQEAQAPSRPAQTTKAPSAKAAESSAPEKTRDVDDGGARTVDLKPSKQRTQGKKSMACSLA